MALALDLSVAAVVLLALVVGAVAQLLVAFHALRFVAVHGSGNFLRVSPQATFALLLGNGLSEAASHHRKRFLRWFAVLLVCIAVLFAWDAFLRQPNSAGQADTFRLVPIAPTPGAAGRERWVSLMEGGSSCQRD